MDSILEFQPALCIDWTSRPKDPDPSVARSKKLECIADIGTWLLVADINWLKLEGVDVVKVKVPSTPLVATDLVTVAILAVPARCSLLLAA